MHALIDGDILIYRVGFASQDIEVGLACARMNTVIENIKTAVGATKTTVYLTSNDKSNFRFALFPEYKANRKAPKPNHYHELRAHLIAEYKAVVVSGREADDALADAQTDETVICSIDKDLDQVAGKHYDFVKDVIYDVEPARGIRFFYFQLLTGDATDNVPGVTGCGPKGAGRILEGATNEHELFTRVESEYQRRYGPERGPALLTLYGRLLKIGGNVWDGAVGDKVSTDQDSKLKSDLSLSSEDSSSSP